MKSSGVSLELFRCRSSFAVSNPFISGIWTSIKMAAKSFLKACRSASWPEWALTRLTCNVLQDALVGQQVGRIVVDDQDIDVSVDFHVDYRWKGRVGKSLSASCARP